MKVYSAEGVANAGAAVDSHCELSRTRFCLPNKMPFVKKLESGRWPHQLNTNDLSINIISPELTLAAYSVAREARHRYQPTRTGHFQGTV